jgi:hypothetical protein
MPKKHKISANYQHNSVMLSLRDTERRNTSDDVALSLQGTITNRDRLAIAKEDRILVRR